MPRPTVLSSREEFARACDDARRAGHTVGFVPTMGALHDGHLALVHEARRRAGFVAVSIFVNPTQFGPNEDFARYPRTLDADLDRLGGAADVVFAPTPETMYPPGDETRVRVGPLAAGLCGPFRPQHFEGVCTVVTKLFAVTGPSVAVFGRKDFQQLAILRRVAQDLGLPVTVVGYPIVREPDGLALSSRNAYLSPPERQRALALSRGLAAAWDAYAEGERDPARLAELTKGPVAAAADRIDYIEVVDPVSLQAAPEGAAPGASTPWLVAIACHVGKTRLIDNVVLGEDPRPVPAQADAGRATP
jgi:pantoate--beta-alanine ligase